MASARVRARAVDRARAMARVRVMAVARVRAMAVVWVRAVARVRPWQWLGWRLRQWFRGSNNAI